MYHKIENGVQYQVLEVEHYGRNEVNWYNSEKQLHRENGPAVTVTTYGMIGTTIKSWYYLGNKIAVRSQEEFEQWKKLKSFI